MFQEYQYYHIGSIVFFVTDGNFVLMNNLQNYKIYSNNNKLYTMCKEIGYPKIVQLKSPQLLLSVVNILHRKYYFVPQMQDIIFSIDENYQSFKSPVVRSVFTLHKILLSDIRNMNCFEIPFPTLPNKNTFESSFINYLNC